MTQYTINSKLGCVSLWSSSTGMNVWWSSLWLGNLATNYFWKQGCRSVGDEALSGTRLWKWRSLRKCGRWKKIKNVQERRVTFGLCKKKKNLLGMKKMNKRQKNNFSYSLGKSKVTKFAYDKYVSTLAVM